MNGPTTNDAVVECSNCGHLHYDISTRSYFTCPLHDEGCPCRNGARPVPYSKRGARVRLTRDVERYPHFIARAGMVGTVTYSNTRHHEVAVKLDDLLPGAEAWDNEVCWSQGEVADFASDTAPA